MWGVICEKEEENEGGDLIFAPAHLHGLAFTFWETGDHIQKLKTTPRNLP